MHFRGLLRACVLLGIAVASVPHGLFGQASAAATADESADDIFRRVFGGAPPPLPPSSYPVMEGGFLLGNFNINPPKDGAGGDIESSFVTNVLIPRLDPQIAAKASTLAARSNRVALDALRELGITVTFDPRALTLSVELPNDIQSTKILQMRSTPRPFDSVKTIKPAGFSAYATIQAGTTYVEASRQGKTGFTETAADVQLAFNLHGMVAEAKVTYDQSQRRKIGHETIRLTYDDLENLIRYEAGDLTVRRSGLQGNAKIAGLSIHRQYAIDPYKITRPISSQAFELSRPSRVQVFVNGSFLREFNLREGKYLLRDLPLLSSTSNDIELRIISPSGQTEILRFPAFFDFELLEQGLVDFSISAGVSYRDEGGTRRYSDDPAGSAFVRYGLTKSLTAGVNWQGNSRFDLVGVDLTWAAPIGTFRFQVASNVRQLGKDTAQMGIAYRWLGRDNKINRTFDLSALFTGKDFELLDSFFTVNRFIWQLRARYAQNIGRLTRAQLYGSYDWNRFDFRDDVTFGTNISRQMNLGSLSLGGEFRRNEDGSQLIGRLGFTLPLGKDTLTADYTTDDDTARLQYSRTPDQAIGGFGMSAAIDRSRRGNSARGGLSYIGNRFEGEVEHIAQNYFGDGYDRDMRTRVSAASSLVFADGALAVSRPIYNSFAMFGLNEAAGDYQLAVDPHTDFSSSDVRYSAKSGAFGPAVVPDLSAYYLRSVQVDAPNAPPGSATGGTVYSLRPTYRSGFNIQVGGEGNASAVGRLVGNDGAPVSYAAGTAADITDPGKYPPATVFTNASGRFFIEQMIAGHRYEVNLEFKGKNVRFEIDVPKATRGIYKIEQPFIADFSASNAGEATAND